MSQVLRFGTMSGKSSPLAHDPSEAFRAHPEAPAAALWEAVFEHSACGQLLLTPEGDIQAINHKACLLLGYARDALIGTRCHTLTHPGDLSSELDHWRSLQDGHLPSFRLEQRCLKQNGQIIWVEWHVSMLRDAQGQACQAVAVLHDISTRKHIERSLRERDVLLRSLDHIPGAIYKVLLPAQGEPQLLYASTRAAQLYEVDPACTTLNWTTHYKRVHPDDLHTVTRLVEASLQHQSQPVQYEYRIIHPTQGLRWLSGEAVAQALPDGSTAWYGYTADVTEQRQGALRTPQLEAPAPPAVTTMVTHTDIRLDRLPPPPPSSGADPAALPAPAAAVRPIRVLYAEDNEINVLLVEQAFKMRPQWELVVATDGSSALEQAKQQRPDMMLVDLNLGDMSGFDLVEALEQDPDTRDIARVALTADTLPESLQAAQRHGFLDYLTKPVDVLALLRCLDELLANGLQQPLSPAN
ncbi:PAS domain-containing protein [Aquabacterium sp.]|uniref:response regulator n=1 Tax=Aquabacterium sp. TaxID=1872578 RepID=UPI002E312647|nr:PAS domain-containing protein [Aquabacterium sp.]HEX5311150.1 PAS domain-containing protein [Aquabacterium sp.]